MIHITEDEEVLLPKRYHKLNNFCAILYDQITEIFSDENYKDLTTTNIDIAGAKQLSEELRRGEIHALEWLKTNNLDDELAEVLGKHLTMSIAFDFVNFMYESLNCAKKGKMTVAYALLRKPLTDELLILEQLLKDPKEFIHRFYHSGDPTTYDPSDRKIDKHEIIRSSINKVSPNIIFREEIIYELRYDKASQAGINGITNHALHIVTNDKNYRTSNQNLNFIFSTEEDITSYWDHYYYFVPYLLLYATSVIDALVFRHLSDQDNENLQAIKSFRRLVGALLYSEWTNSNSKASTKKMYASLSSLITFDCGSCLKKIKVKKVDFELFFHTELFLCPHCFESLLSTPKSIIPIKEYIDVILK